jgi:hypothetical protein
MNKTTNIINHHKSFVDDIKTIIRQGRLRAYRAINNALLETYWNLGRRIVEEEQQGKERADYGSFLIKNLSEILTQEFGQGYSATNLKDFRQFYLIFSESKTYYALCNVLPIAKNQNIEKSHTVCGELQLIENKENTILHTMCAEFNASLFGNLSWSHIRSIMRVDNLQARLWYLKTKQITYQDVGQMDMYIQMYDKMKRTETDNPTIGIILCSETDSDVARYSILGKSDQLFASKYKLYLPTEEELRREIERQKEIYRLQMENKVEI